MRVAFLGKGGSGKSTVASLFIQYLAGQGKHVLAIDADINVHLQEALQLKGNAQAIGDLFGDISNYLKGSRADLGKQPVVATTPPSMNSCFISPKQDDPFVKKYALQEGNISLLSIGSYSCDDVGHTCYHGKLNTLELIYHHMIDREDDIVVADVTAGIDNLGTSLYFAYDINMFIVEPTAKSAEVFNAFYNKAKPLGLNVRVIANKLEEGDEEFISRHIPKDILIGSIPRSRYIKQFEQGSKAAFGDFIRENKDLVQDLYKEVMSVKKDWSKYYESLLTTHKQNSKEWWNDYYGHKIDKQLDPEFRYDKVI